MKNFLKLISVILGLSVISAHAKSSHVMHFDASSVSWQNEVVPNMDKIDSIVASGSYAWAINQTAAVAFYDGIIWHAGMQIPGIAKLSNLVSGFPISAKNPIAWATGYAADNSLVAAYFDGQSWSSAVKITSQHARAILNASAGYAWLSYYDADSNTERFLMSDSQSPNSWQVLALPFQGPVLQERSNNDDVPYYYVLGSPFGALNNYSLVRVDAKGNWEYLQNNLFNGFFTFNVMKNHIGLNHALFNDSSDYAYSEDNGKSWKHSNLPAGYNSIGEDNGVVCWQGSFSLRNKVTCTNTHIEKPVWNEFTIPDALMVANSMSIGVYSSSVWLGTRTGYGESIRYITKYNPLNKQLTDTNIANVANDLLHGYPFIKELNEGKMLTCGLDKNSIPACFYHDGLNWNTKIIGSNFKNSCLSVNGSARNPDVNINQHVWVFEDEKCNEAFLK